MAKFKRLLYIFIICVVSVVDILLNVFDTILCNLFFVYEKHIRFIVATLVTLFETI